MKNILKTFATSAAGLVMRCLAATGVVTESRMFFQNWRRPANCTCDGCVALSTRGEPLECSSKYLAWTADTVVDRRVNYATIAAYLVAAFLLVHPLGGPLAYAIVTTAGKNDLLTQYFKGSAYTATWYIGLVDGGSAPTYAAADTMSSHSGWTENTGYSNSNRVTWTGGTASGGSIDNSGAVAAFNINATSTIAGAFMVTNNTKGGTTGTLYSESNFTQGNRSVVSGDTLNVTSTETVS